MGKTPGKPGLDAAGNPGVRFTPANKYILPGRKGVFCFNLPSGFTCPGAKQCLTFAARTTGKIRAGAESEYRCYAAVTERMPSVRSRLWLNYGAMLACGDDAAAMTAELLRALPKRAQFVRIHSNGDYYSQPYFDAWLAVARATPAVSYWAFTKSLPFWVARLGEVPSNLTLQASTGSHHDELIAAHGLKYARVVYTREEAEALGLPIDTDDALAMSG